MENGEKINPKTQQEALLEVSAIIEQTMKVGSVTDESDSLQEIFDALHAGKMAPEEALRQAREIQTTKRQDYH